MDPRAVEAARKVAPRADAVPVATTRVLRIALPRYQVEYTDPAEALGVAKKLRESRILLLSHVIPGDVGGDVVLDLALSGEPLQVGLFFRILQRSPASTMFEWCARRATDTDLLELWIQTIELRVRVPARGPGPSSADVDVSRVLETCRRALQRNPFTALKVHWTAGDKEIAAAVEALSTELLAAQRSHGLPPSVAELVAKALAEVVKTGAMVSTADGRRRARSLYVPVDQIQHAIELALSKADLARIRGDAAELTRARSELTELGARPMR